MALQLHHREAGVMLPAHKHRAFAFAAPAHRQQGQILLQRLQALKLLAPCCTLWCMRLRASRINSMQANRSGRFNPLQKVQRVT